MSEVVFQPMGRYVEARPGDTLLEAAQAAGVALSAVCGGIGVCGNCRVRVQSGAVSPLNRTEQELLSESDRAGSFRLACQTQIEAGAIVVDVPPDSLSAKQRSQVEGREIPLEVAPAIQVHDQVAAPPSMTDLRGDWERTAGITPSGWSITAPVLADLPVMLRRHNWHVRMVTHGQSVVGFLPPDVVPLGFAVDVGTTSLAAYLVDLSSGEMLGVAGTTNPQIVYGEDVMARLALVMHHPPAAAQLQTAVVEGLNALLREVCAQADVPTAQVVDLVAVGNTAMHHLLLALPIGQLGSAPYVPAVSSALYTPARALGLEVAPGALLYTPPNVAGFVGGDHISMLLATKTAEQPGVTLSLDIGTNTEISLNAHGKLWCCSAASGPAFEGAHIHDGMRAVDGAIERLVWQDGRLHWLTINHVPPVGLCGSGILDAVAALRAANILTETGAMRHDHPYVQGSPTNLWSLIVPAEQTGHGRPVTVSRADVSEVQLAKAAIRTGIKLLVEQAELSEQEIDRVIVAGAFGNYIDLKSAITIGMLPPLPLEHFHQVGNAAGMGSKRLLINAEERQRADTLAHDLQYLELTNHPHFADRFSQAVVLLPDLWD